MSWIADIAREAAEHGAVVRVCVVRADGSTPRETGAAMHVTARDVRATIGGGALELEAIAHARRLLAASSSAPSPRSSRGEGRGEGQPLAPALGSAAAPHPDPLPIEKNDGEREAAPAAAWVRDVRDFALGPSLGQCCGGHTRLLFELFTAAEAPLLAALAHGADPARAVLLRPLDGGTPPVLTADRREHRAGWPLAVTRTVRDMLTGARARAPALVIGRKGEKAWFVEPCARAILPLYVYGAGHVGRALVHVLRDLPFAVTWVDTAPVRFPADVPAHVRAHVAPDVAAFAAHAAVADALHIVLTYSHALDLAICHNLLRRGDVRFVGLIGSRTKRARFTRRLSDLGIAEAQIARLACPIGLPGIGSKEPGMIAIAVAAQLAQLAAAAEPARRSHDGDAALAEDAQP